MYLSTLEQLRLSTGALGILLFVASVIALHFAPHRLDACALMATLSFLALAFAFSAKAA